MSIQWFDRPSLDRVIVKYISRVDVVLDIGSGIRPQTFFRPRVHICCEPHPEYVEVLKKQLHRHNLVILQSTWMSVLALMPNQSVDSVFLLDLIEHLDKEEGAQLLSECNRVARVQVVVFTPLGFMTQEYMPGEVDGWGFHGSEWQVHKSGWEPSDFGPSWTILGARHYHLVNGKGEPFDPPVGAFWAINNLDHTGFDLKPTLRTLGHRLVDAGCDRAESFHSRVIALSRRLHSYRSSAAVN